MATKLNISQFEYCYGCGVCSAACPKEIITLSLNDDGFYQPKITAPDKCVECGLCLNVCAFNHRELALQNNREVHSWAAWSNDAAVRRKCSSGGVAFEIGKQLIQQGYLAVGCRYDIERQRAEHYIATTVEEFVQSIGSKYIQSYTEEAFKSIQRKGQKYLVTGTPCQIDSFRRWIQKFHCEDNFILLDFFCHCVPSMWAWKSYIKMLEPKIGEVTYASWRNKFQFGWHDSWIMGVDGVNTCKPINWHDSYNFLIREKKTSYQSRMSQGDIFYDLFLSDFCPGPQCEKECKYKLEHSSADIRVGDLWGKAYADNQEGVSALISFTEKGEHLIKDLKGITLIEHPLEVVTEGQLKRNVQRKPFSRIVVKHLKGQKPIDTLYFRSLIFSLKVVGKLNRIIHR